MDNHTSHFFAGILAVSSNINDRCRRNHDAVQVHCNDEPETYLFGYMGLLVGSIVLNFASYNFMDIEEFNVNMWVMAFSNILVCAFAYWLFPEPKSAAEHIEMSTPVKSDIDYISQVAMGWVVAMAAFIVFQVADLYDSLSAQASILIILTPMTLAARSPWQKFASSAPH